MSGNLWCDISDHLPNYVIVSNPKKNKPSCERPLTRIYSDKNIKTFQHLISSTVWDDIYNHRRRNRVGRVGQVLHGFGDV